jgi:hypothetical protein
MDFTEAKVAHHEDKEGSDVLETLPAVKHSNLPSPSYGDVPEGGRAAWATAFGA